MFTKVPIRFLYVLLTMALTNLLACLFIDPLKKEQLIVAIISCIAFTTEIFLRKFKKNETL